MLLRVVRWPPPYCSTCHKGSPPFFLLLPFLHITQWKHGENRGEGSSAGINLRQIALRPATLGVEWPLVVIVGIFIRTVGQ